MCGEVRDRKLDAQLVRSGHVLSSFTATWLEVRTGQVLSGQVGSPLATQAKLLCAIQDRHRFRSSTSDRLQSLEEL